MSMTLVDTCKSLSFIIERLLPNLQNDPTENIITSALLRCCREWGVTTERELLLLLTSDCPFVQRQLWMIITQENRRQVNCHFADVQRLIQKLLLSLSKHYISQNYTATLLQMNDTNFNFSSMSTSVADLLSSVALEGMTSTSVTQAGASFFFTTGCPSLDILISGSNRSSTGDTCDGGFRAGFLTEVYGEAGSGKTQLVLQSLLQCVAQHICALWDHSDTHKNCVSGSEVGVAALYIVSEEFSAARLAALATGAVKRAKQKAIRAASHLPPSSLNRLMAHLDEAVTTRNVMAALHIRCISTLKDLLCLLHDGVLCATFRMLGGRGIVVVDSIAGMIGSGDIENSDIDKGYVVTVGALLKTFAVKEGAAVIVTNQVRSLMSSHRKHGGTCMVVPAMGFQWSLAPHVRIHLRRLPSAEGNSLRQLTVLSGPAQPPVFGVYVIGNDGIQDDP